jgi:hypothetical protein
MGAKQQKSSYCIDGKLFTLATGARIRRPHAHRNLTAILPLFSHLQTDVSLMLDRQQYEKGKKAGIRN